MKKILMILCMMIVSVGVYAQSVEPVNSDTAFVVDLGTFTGIVAVVSFLVTQISKVISFVNENKWAKIAISVFVGAGICAACWATGLAPFLSGLTWWQVIIYGVGAGLSGCGFYEIVKPILDALFGKKEVIRLDN
jgi:hypothetical protein|nr:MAG TPA: holin [Caudoviricetes sp.]